MSQALPIGDFEAPSAPASASESAVGHGMPAAQSLLVPNRVVHAASMTRGWRTGTWCEKSVASLALVLESQISENHGAQRRYARKRLASMRRDTAAKRNRQARLRIAGADKANDARAKTPRTTPQATTQAGRPRVTVRVDAMQSNVSVRTSCAA